MGKEDPKDFKINEDGTVVRDPKVDEIKKKISGNPNPKEKNNKGLLWGIVAAVILFVGVIASMKMCDNSVQDSSNTIVILQHDTVVRYSNYAEQQYHSDAEKGDAQAQFCLGNCFYYGKNGAPQSYSEAVKWFRKAAEQGHPEAQNKLGYCYEKGKGVTENLKKAKSWYKMASKQGNNEAKKNLMRLDNKPNSKTFTANGVSFTMVYVPGGTFQMGSNDGDSDEKPIHSVTLSGYSIGQTEVTQELWQAVMENNPSRFKGSKRPVECVSWNDCQDFIRKLDSITGQRFRLPTEAEWEFAARGGNSTHGYTYSGSNTIDNVAWYDKNSYDKGSHSPDYGTHNVATKSTNELGIYDMSGNVWEWCSDLKGSYSSGSQTNPQGASTGSNRVGRGGSWDSSARICLVANRSNFTPGYRSNRLGLRLAI